MDETDIVRKVMRVFADNELFEEGVELIGSWCFHMYQKHLGARNFPLRTQDVDFYIPQPFRGKRHGNFIVELEGLGFNTDFNSDGSLFLWNADLKIEFITAEKGKGVEKAIRIPGLGISAIPLRHVSFLQDDPIVIHDNGINILVPDPARFCLHKLIISSRRKKIEKRVKDLQQALCTSVIVDPKKIKNLFLTLPAKWRTAILKVLGESNMELPLLSSEIDDLMLVLQNRDK